MKKYWERLKRCLIEKRYGEFSLYCLLTLLVSMLVILATAGVLSFFAYNFEAILTIVGGYGLVYVFFHEWRKSKKEEKLREEERCITILNRQREENAETEKALLESNYIIVRKCFHSVIMDIADHVHLKKPTSLSELDSPSRMVSKGNVTMYQFVALKTSQEMNPAVIKDVLQTRMTQKLSSNEIAGLSQTTYIYEGQAFPLLCIDEVVDIGNYIQIDLAWASESYCRLIQDRKLAYFEGQRVSNLSIKDKDF